LIFDSEGSGGFQYDGEASVSKTKLYRCPGCILTTVPAKRHRIKVGALRPQSAAAPASLSRGCSSSTMFHFSTFRTSFLSRSWFLPSGLRCPCQRNPSQNWLIHFHCATFSNCRKTGRIHGCS